MFDLSVGSALCGVLVAYCLVVVAGDLVDSSDAYADYAFGRWLSAVVGGSVQASIGYA